MEISSSSPVYFPPVSYFYSVLLSAAALLNKMIAPSVLVTQFLNAFVLRALRNAFWKWGEDKWEESANSLDLWFKICVSYQMLRKMLQGGSPTLN